MPRLNGMDTQTPTTTPPTRIDDLFTLHLVDGLATQAGAQEVRYRVVRLRETNVNDERAAVKLSERVMVVGGQPRLMSSDAEFRLAMTMRHVTRLEADSAQALDGALLDLDLFGRLSAHDLGLIEQRVFLITLAAQVRYGLIKPEEFDAVVAGKSTEAAAAPQPLGQAAGPGAAAPAAESGPALLADNTRRAAAHAAAGAGR